MYPDNETLELFGEPVSWPGLDENDKFTNGSFTDPAVWPSFIPAQTVNLTLDNLSTLLVSLGATPNNTDSDQLALAFKNTFDRQFKKWLDEVLFPVGTGYEQGINDPSPVDLGLPGTWVVWNDRAEAYRLRQTPLPSYTVYTPGLNYAVGVHVMYHLHGDDWAIYRATVAITDAAEQLDPVKWEQLRDGIIIERRYLQEWTDDDFEIGHVIADGEFDGYVVEEVIVRGGKFFSYAGGNRPTYVTGGTHGDTIRQLYGEIEVWGDSYSRSYWHNATGILGTLPLGTSNYVMGRSNIGYNGEIGFFIDSRLVVPTGPENSPVTLSMRYYRRVD